MGSARWYKNLVGRLIWRVEVGSGTWVLKSRHRELIWRLEGGAVFVDIKAKIPWWGKIVAKLVLSRLPVGYAFWQKLGVKSYLKLPTKG